MQSAPLKNIAEFIRTGKTPPTKEQKYFNGNIQWFTPCDLDKNKYLAKSTRTLTEASFVDKKAVVYPKGTLLVSCIGDIGKLGITSEDCSSNQQITGIKPSDDTDVNYLYYWFRHGKLAIQHLSNNAVVPILNNRTLEKVKIPLPPLAEQKKIAAILDAADRLRQKDAQLIAKYNALSQSLFLDMFGDPVTNENHYEVSTLGDVTSKVTDGVHAKPEYTDKGIPFISVKDITTGTLNFEKCKFIAKEAHDKYFKRCNPELGDILYTKVGATYGRASIVDVNFPFSLYVSVALLKPIRDIVNPMYLKEAMVNPVIKRQADKAIKGIGVPDLHLNMIKKFNILLPPITLQNQFAERIQAIETQKQQAQAALQKSEDLFSSLLQRAFKGELTA